MLTQNHLQIPNCQNVTLARVLARVTSDTLSLRYDKSTEHASYNTWTSKLGLLHITLGR